MIVIIQLRLKMAFYIYCCVHSDRYTTRHKETIVEKNQQNKTGNQSGKNEIVLIVSVVRFHR